MMELDVYIEVFDLGILWVDMVYGGDYFVIIDVGDLKFCLDLLEVKILVDFGVIIICVVNE